MDTANPRDDTALSPEQQELLDILLQEERAQSARRSDAVVPIQKKGMRTPIFSIGVFRFRLLAKHLGSDQPFYGLIGRDLDPGFDYLNRVRELARAYIEDVRTIQPHGPYQFIGLCFGGLVAYEMACQLHELGERTSFLAVLDATVPQTRRQETLREKWDRNRRAFHKDGWRHLVSYAGGRSRAEIQRVSDLYKRMMVRIFLKLERPIPEKWMERYLQRIHSRAQSNYVAPHYPGKVTVIRCLKAGWETTGDTGLKPWADPTFGWNQVADQVDVIDITGRHQHTLDEPDVIPLAARIREAIDAAQPR